ncbi:M36 family metallopeptidase [Moheibacter sediminis]|uniref:Fungalysin/Thermolysin Propeptide Motif n=1 Tax=Moheibacter sediminis TaxID=1434700 RepID=A0A1W1YFD1_9FLAO|nr:M36 family metallopeptidase [Moheibacter sediminis]SMC34531.1 Fungalysin/Thermolysin Propeptide Motif [Moheibacter sediminis]
MKTNLYFLIVFLCLNIKSFAQTEKPDAEFVRQKLTQAMQKDGLSLADLAEFSVTSFSKEKKKGIQHIYLRQTMDDLEIFGTESGLFLKADGSLISANNQFISSVSSKKQGSAQPSLDALQAVNRVAAYLGYVISEPLVIISEEQNVDRKTRVSKGGMASREIPARLMYMLKDDGNIELVWEISIEEKSGKEWYTVFVSAHTGQVIRKFNMVISCSFEHGNGEHNGVHSHSLIEPENHFHEENNSLTINGSGAVYNVFDRPLDNPYHGGRILVAENDVANLTASPYGWHDTEGVAGPEYFTTRGNNVNAYEDRDANNTGGYQPNASSLLFDYPFDQNYSASNRYQDAAITNLFYWSNLMHDIFYQYGFDETSGNFQANNYGKGGIGNDFVLAEAQDGSSTCNANFGTPADGLSPRMQMFTCNNKDGDYDNIVIAHEYGHGISTRLTGGAAFVYGLSNREQMGEGWSDWFGLMITIKPGDTGISRRTVGNYLYGQGIGGDGIRTYPYTTDMSINPQTYDAIKTAGTSPHKVGEVWTGMLWEMTWALIDEYGYDADVYDGTGGNNIAMHLVMEGLKLQPTNPGFVDGRDAILLADHLLYDGANQCIIWNAFAKRGLGVSADQGTRDSVTDGTQDFSVPDPATCSTCPIPIELNQSQQDLTSTQLSWVSDGTSFDLEWGLKGFTQGEGNLVEDIAENSYLLEEILSNTNYEYYVRSNCDETITSGWAGPYGFILGAEGYCTPSTSDASYMWINNISLNEINNPTGGIAGYNNYTHLVANVERGNTYLLSIGVRAGGYPVYATAFIDWNQNGLLENEDERYNVALNVTSNGTYTFNLPVPMDAVAGNTRMRIMLQYFDQTPDACVSFYYGEIEDYTVNVLPCPKPIELTADYQSTDSMLLGWSSIANSFEIEWGAAGFVQGNGTMISDISENSYLLTGLTENNEYNYYVRSDCGTDGNSSWTGPFTFIMAESFACDYKFVLTDQYGDTWNGNTMNVIQNGNVINTLELTEPETATEYVSLTNGIPFELFWNPGGEWPEEVAIQVYDASDVLIYEKFSNSGNQNTTLYTGNTNCPQPITWTIANVWSNETGPTLSDDIIIKGDYTGSSFEAKNITVFSTGSLDITDGNTVTLAGKITTLSPQFTDETLTSGIAVRNGGNLIQTTAFTETNKGQIIVFRDSDPMKRLDYTFWSSPVYGQQLQGFSPQTLPNRIYTYEGINEYVAVSNANDLFAAGKGYLFRSPNNWITTATTPYKGEFLGTPFNGTFGVNVHSNEYTSVGNPYPSNIDADVFLAQNLEVETLYFWTNTSPATETGYEQNNYAYYTLMGGTDANGDGTSEIPNGIISIGQGFIVKTNNASTVNFNNSMRISGAAPFFKADKHRFWLNLSGSNGTGLNQILVGYQENATNEFDAQIDGRMFNFSGNALYSLINSEKFVIQGRAMPFETFDVVPLGFYAAETGRYSISIKETEGLFTEGQLIYMKDQYNETLHNLTEAPYDFVSEAGQFDERFQIVYETKEIMGVDDSNLSGIQIYQHNQNIVVFSKNTRIISVEIFDLVGRNMYNNTKVNSNQIEISKQSFGKQVLVIRVKTENGDLVTKKIVIKD